MDKKKSKQTRAKIFKGGTNQIKISSDIYDKISEDAKDKRLYPSQVVDKILREHYTM
jgi:hypothetical protein